MIEKKKKTGNLVPCNKVGCFTMLQKQTSVKLSRGSSKKWAHSIILISSKTNQGRRLLLPYVIETKKGKTGFFTAMAKYSFHLATSFWASASRVGSFESHCSICSWVLSSPTRLTGARLCFLSGGRSVLYLCLCVRCSFGSVPREEGSSLHWLSDLSSG